MKEILDIIVWGLFIFMLVMFIVNFNRQQIKKHTDKLAQQEDEEEIKSNKDEENKGEKI